MHDTNLRSEDDVYHQIKQRMDKYGTALPYRVQPAVARQSGRALINAWRSHASLHEDAPITVPMDHIYHVVSDYSGHSDFPSTEEINELNPTYNALNSAFSLTAVSNWYTLNVRTPYVNGVGNAIILKAAYDGTPMHTAVAGPNAFVVLQMDNAGDRGRPAGERLVQSSLMYQYIYQQRFVVDTIIMADIQNTDTLGYFRDALQELGSEQARLTTQGLHAPGPSGLLVSPNQRQIWLERNGNPIAQKWFETIVGSDNGRGTQYMLNDYAHYFLNKQIARIIIFDWRGLEALGHLTPDSSVTITFELGH